MTRHLPILCLSLTPTLACTSVEQSGAVQLTTWGEEFIEEGIPAAEFEDDFDVQFERFLIVVGDVRARHADDELEIPGTQLVNLVTPGPHPLATETVLTGNWTQFQYSIAPLADATTLHASATADDRALMEAGPYSVYVEGRATRGDDTFRFAWGFDTATTYTDCVHNVDGRDRPGFSVGVGVTTTVELTIHGDHLFYDDLASDDAGLRFQAMADADADEDGVVTLEELRGVSLIDLPSGRYGTGNFSDVNDLGAFVDALTTTLGHFNGEGHCQPTR